MFYKASGGQVLLFSFANDTMILTQLSRHGLGKIKKFWESYQGLSGQRTNIAKSSFICSQGLLQVKVQLASTIIGF